jgi:hypothetical protein
LRFTTRARWRRRRWSAARTARRSG